MERIQKLQAFLASTPEDPFLKHALALEWVKTGNDEQARLLFEEILNKDPGYIGSYYHLAKLLERSGEHQLAIEWYRKGINVAKAAGDQHALGELKMACEDLEDEYE